MKNFFSEDDRSINLKLNEYQDFLHSSVDYFVDKGEEPDLMLKSLSELVDLAVSCDQFKMSTDLSPYEEVVRVCLIRIRLSRPEIEKIFKVKTVNIYGLGLFAPLPGILLSNEIRKQSKYDESLVRRKVMYDLSMIPEDIRNNYEFRLSVPAMSELFVPKKTRLTEWLNSTKCIKYLDFSQ